MDEGKGNVIQVFFEFLGALKVFEALQDLPDLVVWEVLELGHLWEYFGVEVQQPRILYFFEEFYISDQISLFHVQQIDKEQYSKHFLNNVVDLYVLVPFRILVDDDVDAVRKKFPQKLLEGPVKVEARFLLLVLEVGSEQSKHFFWRLTLVVFHLVDSVEYFLNEQFESWFLQKFKDLLLIGGVAQKVVQADENVEMNIWNFLQFWTFSELIC